MYEDKTLITLDKGHLKIRDVNTFNLKYDWSLKNGVNEKAVIYDQKLMMMRENEVQVYYFDL
jgi:hypothetical protein